MNTIKAKINSLIQYAENNTIKVLPTLQDIRNIKEYAIVGSRQVRIVLLNRKIHKLADKLEKAQTKKWSLVQKNIAPLFNDSVQTYYEDDSVDYHKQNVLADICEEMEQVREEC